MCGYKFYVYAYSDFYCRIIYNNKWRKHKYRNLGKYIIIHQEKMGVYHSTENSFIFLKFIYFLI